MINIPLDKIKEKIITEKGISKLDLDAKIKLKLEQLSGLISEEGAAHIIANEMGVKLIQQAGRLEIRNIVEGLRNVEVVGKVAQKYEVREFDKGEHKGKVGSFLLADTTGKVRVVLWNDQADAMEKFVEGDTIKLTSGYVKANNGRKEVHLGDTSSLKINPSDVSLDFNLEDLGPKKKKIVDLTVEDDNVELLATIVQVYDPRFFEIDASTGRRVREGTSPKETDFSYVTNGFLDDGSDNIRCVFWKGQTQRLFGLTDDEIKALKDNPAGFETIKNDLLGNIVRVLGRVQNNEAMDRLEFVANYVEKNPDPAKEIKKLEDAVPPVTKKEKPGIKNKESQLEAGEKQIKQGTKVESKVTISDEAVKQGMMDVDAAEEIDLSDMSDDDIPSIDDL